MKFQPNTSNGLKVVEGDGPTDRQTDRQTLQNIGILANPKIQFFAYFGLQSGPPFARDGSPIKLIIHSALIPN